MSPHEGYDDNTGTTPHGRVWITRARYKRLVADLTGGAPALENQVKGALNLEFAIIDPLPLLAITPEAKEALTRLIGGLLASGTAIAPYLAEKDHRAAVERLLNEHLDVVDA